MVKENKSESKKNPSRELTEWQRRNLEFQRKKRQQALEDKKIREKLLAEKLPRKKEDVKENNIKKVKVKIKRKKKDKNFPLKFKFLSVLVASIIVFLISLFFITPFSYSKIISVTGIKYTIENSVIEASKIQSKTYLTDVLFNRKHFEDNIKKNDKWVKSAQIRYQFPNRFNIKLIEHKIIGYSQTQSGLQPVLETGAIMDAINTSELPKSYLTINLTNRNKIKRLVKELKALNEKLFKQIRSINLIDSKTTSNLLALEMEDGNTVRVPLSELSKKLPYYTKIASNLQAPAIVDMEVGLYSTTEEIETLVSSSETNQENSQETNTETSSEQGNQTSNLESETATETTQ